MNLAVDPGRLSARLELERETETPDGAGGFSGQWISVASIWADIRPLVANFVERANTATSDISHEITVRHRLDIREAMRFRKGARLFLIDALFDPDETGRWLKCLTREIG